MLTEKENLLMTLRGETPEWVPRFVIFPIPGSTPANLVCFPSILNRHLVNHGGKDIWGVTHVPTYETGGALIPEPNNFILKDVTKWRDVIKAPDLDGIDWEATVKKDLDFCGIERSQTALALSLHNGYFQLLMEFMGFTNGLCAMYEEPDAVKELFAYLSDFYCTVLEKTIDYYNPDILMTADDTAAWRNPFISPEMFREFLIPLYDRQLKFARDRGLPITFHNCGKCECFMDDLYNIGVTMWDPAQTCNDLDGFKRKYGNKLVLAGGWDASGRLLDDDVSEEEIYESIRASIERLAPGGGYVWAAGFLGPIDSEACKRKNYIMDKAVNEIGRAFYKK
jgi:hypothetical protein